ncbi:high mobility group B protein 10-like isoform X2 [Lotus japonicus]|uniref:high mobility group B protein 10-like isoform X2 n=1 Tax=Lotus japonicus TaxID=34305 RepID=UPI00258F3903|nr:high mobility group B protein 10-like isoform X2 [Lotus japonicus]
MTTTSDSGTQQQHRHQLQNVGNGNASASLTPTNPYLPPTALYQNLTRDANLFWEKLRSFHKSFDTKFKVPTIGGKPLDLYRLFIEVTSRGGLEKVLDDRKWKEVILAFKFRDTITSASFMVRRYYLSLLYHFEQVYYFRKQVPPSSTPDPGNRSLANSSTPIREGAAVNDIPVQVSPAQTPGSVVPGTIDGNLNAVSPVPTPGSVVPGTIDGKFDGGYIVTVSLGSEQVKGILYHVPDNVSQSSYAEGMPSSRKKSKSALRDPSLPKSNRSGYNFFFAENYARLRPSFQGQEKEISKRIGFLWSNLSEAERQVYQDKALRDKERYQTGMQEYKSNHPAPQ